METEEKAPNCFLIKYNDLKLEIKNTVTTEHGM
jgi:hypothetical protein